MGQPTDPTFTASDSESLSAGTVRPIKGTNRGSLRVADAEPARASWCRSRYCYSPGVVANAQVPVVDVGTTLAAMALWNGEPDGGKSLFVEMVAAHAASGTLGLGGGLMVCLSGSKQAAAVTNGTGVVLGKLGGQSSTTLAKFGANITLSAAGAWITVASFKMIAEINIGAAMIGWLDGLIEVPPGYCLGLQTLAPTGTTAKFSYSVVWSEWAYTNYA